MSQNNSLARELKFLKSEIKRRRYSTATLVISNNVFFQLNMKQCLQCISSILYLLYYAST